ncbi:MAG: serine protease [Anaerolineales bacterium]|nr:serine protease [Anaerolineales bacterium]
MKYPFMKPLFLMATLFLVVGLACGAPTPTPEPPAEVKPAEPVQQAEPAEPAEPVQQSASGAAASLQDVRGAVIQIEAEGSFASVDEDGNIVDGYLESIRGSGFIIDPSGIAVTNNHVVTGAALLKVWIGGDTSKTYNARVLGVSECSDLAVIQIDGDGFPFLDWYSNPVEVGIDVYSAGFPLGETEFTLTKGIVSKENADGSSDWASVDSVIMHDATINPGNSGGPLVSADGKIVGVNYASISSANQYFAIGREKAIPIIDELKTGKDKDTIGISGWAFSYDDAGDVFSGVFVTSVESGSAADRTGVIAGDIITSLENHPIGEFATMEAYCDIIRTHSASDQMDIEVYRDSSGDIMEGQLNGNKLVVTFDGVGADDATSGTSSGTSTGGTTSETTGDPPAYPLEEFNAEYLENWSWFVTNGDENQFYLYSDNGKLVFELVGPNIYSYLLYDPWIYESVIIETSAENRGKNTNNVGLVCHVNDYGWYEFSISNGGEWWIWAYDATTDQYDMLASGGSTAVRMGKDINEYGVICDSNTLALFINGVHTHTLTDKQYAFREGQIGIGVSSFDVLPIVIEFDWVDVNSP